MKLIIIKGIIASITLIAGVGVLYIRKKFEEEQVSEVLQKKILFILLLLLCLSAIAQLVATFVN